MQLPLSGKLYLLKLASKHFVREFRLLSFWLQQTLWKASLVCLVFYSWPFRLKITASFGLLNLHRLNIWGKGCVKYGCGAGEAVQLNIPFLLSFYLVTIFQITAFRDLLIPIASVLCPTCITCSSVTCIDFLLQVKIEVDISCTVWSRRDQEKRVPRELHCCSKFQSAYPFPGKLKAHS